MGVGPVIFNKENAFRYGQWIGTGIKIFRILSGSMAVIVMAEEIIKLLYYFCLNIERWQKSSIRFYNHHRKTTGENPGK